LNPINNIIIILKTIRKIEADDHFILMGCDGVYELYSNDELVQKIRELMDKKFTKQEIIE